MKPTPRRSSGISYLTNNRRLMSCNNRIKTKEIFYNCSEESMSCLNMIFWAWQEMPTLRHGKSLWSDWRRFIQKEWIILTNICCLTLQISLRLLWINSRIGLKKASNRALCKLSEKSWLGKEILWIISWILFLNSMKGLRMIERKHISEFRMRIQTWSMSVTS